MCGNGGDHGAVGREALRFARRARASPRIPSLLFQSRREDAPAAAPHPCRERRQSWSGRAGCPAFRAFCPRVPSVSIAVGKGGCGGRRDASMPGTEADRGAVGRDVLRFVWPAGVAVRIPSVSVEVTKGGCGGRRTASIPGTEADRGAVGWDVLRFVWPAGVAVRIPSVSVAVRNGGCGCRRAASLSGTEEIVGRSGGTSSVSCGQAVWRCGAPPFPVRSEGEDAMGGAPRARAKRRGFRGFGGGTPPLPTSGTRVRGG
ncbi:hypothetical protein AXZ95_2444 [Leifsonia sp. 115AMFTsu3.1]|nr:hypothetical protein AXZ95_2444 [Leifsonia sp. 115AMFTsu3.1]